MNTRAETANSIDNYVNGSVCEPTGAGGAGIYWLATYRNTTCDTPFNCREMIPVNCREMIPAKRFPLPMAAHAHFAMQIGKQ